MLTLERQCNPYWYTSVWLQGYTMTYQPLIFYSQTIKLNGFGLMKSFWQRWHPILGTAFQGNVSREGDQSGRFHLALLLSVIHSTNRNGRKYIYMGGRRKKPYCCCCMVMLMPWKPRLRSPSGISSPFFPPFISPASLFNSSALALFLDASFSSLVAASSRRLASASYSERHISPDFNFEIYQEEKLTTLALVFIVSFFSFFHFFFFLEMRMARGASEAGRLWGPAPKLIFMIWITISFCPDLNWNICCIITDSRWRETLVG